MSAPKRGDIVRYRWKGLFGTAFEAVTIVAAVDDKGRPGTGTYGSLGRLHFHPLTDDLTVVEVAHYAPPGVPMIAMTPERIDALAWSLFVAKQKCLSATIINDIDAMLAEARGERAS